MKILKISVTIIVTFAIAYCLLDNKTIAAHVVVPEHPKKMFIVCGELSGDRLGAWYLEKKISQSAERTCEAIGGDFLQQAGANIYKHFNEVSMRLIGMSSHMRNIPTIYKTFKYVRDLIVQGDYDEVVLVDFPLFNLPLARSIKKRKPSCAITYIAPPELWIWRYAGVASMLRNYCDQIIVLYPHEVAFYKELGVFTQWLGYPGIERLLSHYQACAEKTNTVALLIGSRESEVQAMLEIFCAFAQSFYERFPEVSFIVPLAGSINAKNIKETFAHVCPEVPVRFLIDEEEKITALSQSAFAITKPGTVTLELALLNVPAIIVFQVSSLNYLLAKLLIRVSWVGLPNLIMNDEIFPELLQHECTVEHMLAQAIPLYYSFKDNGKHYKSICAKLDQLRMYMQSSL